MLYKNNHISSSLATILFFDDKSRLTGENAVKMTSQIQISVLHVFPA